MFAVLNSLKNVVIGLIMLISCFFLLHHFSDYWQPHIKLIEQVLFGLLSSAILLSSYFNRSRLTLAAACLLWFYINISVYSTGQLWLADREQWLLLYGSAVFSFLICLKDRSLISSHGVYRFISIGILALLTHYWLVYADNLIVQIDKFSTLSPWREYIRIELPLLVLSLVILWRYFVEQSLTAFALLGCFVVWVGRTYFLSELDWSIVLTMLSALFLLSILIGSYFLAYRDELTTLASRRALNQYVLSLGRNYSAAMLDIDHFKKFNDKYGHDIGDQVLKLVATKLAQVKSGGKVFRYGGEEFTIVFSRKNIEQILPALEAVRQAIEDYKIVIRQEQRKTKKQRNNGKNKDFTRVSVTISIGVAMRESKQSFEQVLKNADLALYRAKKNGRNNVSQ